MLKACIEARAALAELKQAADLMPHARGSATGCEPRFDFGGRHQAAGVGRVQVGLYTADQLGSMLQAAGKAQGLTSI